MTLEERLTSLLRGICPNIYRTVAPFDAPRPYVTYQRIGGNSLVWMDNTLADKRNALCQINTWAEDPAQSDALIQAIESALLASPDLKAEPQGESQDASEPDMELYGARQDWSIWADR
ncbi:DUF3168 domain-containing protein [Massilia agilis]|uniref:DUF3168 domain-containing protein n=1 Tax=Massilia agilis TaxID=1811226 RepID=A0ABT2DE34_9BURK|nr:DUF3168 domain-containing protein [Massilia agilis]MCS0808686.1 DUF3168 domain-containing protein [Massilia agilis]